MIRPIIVSDAAAVHREPTRVEVVGVQQQEQVEEEEEEEEGAS